MKQWWITPILLAWLTGCATVNSNSTAEQALPGNGNTCEELSKPAATRLGIIRQMLAAGKPHAAIAYLDDSAIKAPQAELLRADALRQTGRKEDAVRRYRQLLNSCVAGFAYQGLGLIAFSDGRNSEAVANLRSASDKLPIDSAVRNDYGYALMMAGKDDDALHEFLTAIELAPENRRAARNLLLLLVRSGKDETARAFADRLGVTEEELAQIRISAGRMDTAINADALAGMSPPSADPAAKKHPTGNE